MGRVDQVLVGPDIRNYDVYAFVLYPSVKIFKLIITVRERVLAYVCQREGLGAEAPPVTWWNPIQVLSSEDILRL